MKLLSIIIPIYNVAPYLERCILSLEDQDIPKEEYELICVNDGSPDNCREIVEELQKEYSNIVLINQENRGVSTARNKGIEKATGRYLLFIDADDYIETNGLNEKIHNLLNNNLDVGITGYKALDDNSKIIYKYDWPAGNNKILTGIDFSFHFREDKTDVYAPHRSWAIFFKTTFIKSHNLYFLPGVPYLEDGEFMYRVLCLAKRVSYISGSFYLFTTRPGSARNSMLFITDKAIWGFIHAARNLKEFQKSPSLSSDQRTYLNQPIIKYCLTSVIACTNIRSIHKIFRVRKQLICYNLNKLELSSSGSYHARYGQYYNKSIYYFFIKYMIFKAKTSLNNRFK